MIGDPDDFDQELEKWLIEEVVPAYDKHKAHPERGRTIDQVRAHIAELHRKAVEKSVQISPPDAPEKSRE